MAFVVDAFDESLWHLGFYRTNARMLFLGIDNCGKTALLQMLMDDRFSVSGPTMHPGQAELSFHRTRFHVYDCGGHEGARKLWSSYFSSVDAVVFMVDALDRERFPEAKKELDMLLTCEELAHTPFLILGNKMDVPHAASESELRAAMGLMETSGKDAQVLAGIRPIEVFMCSVLRRAGYGDGFMWLTKHVNGGCGTQAAVRDLVPWSSFARFPGASSSSASTSASAPASGPAPPTHFAHNHGFEMVSAPPSLLVCPSCDSLFLSPVEVCGDGHCVCADCVPNLVAGCCVCGKDTLPADDQLPNRFLNSRVMDLEARCPHYPACSSVVTLRKMAEHVDACPRRPTARRVRDPQGCGRSVLASALEVHQRDDCPLTRVPCPVVGCGDVVQRKDLDKHVMDVKHLSLLQDTLRELKAASDAGGTSDAPGAGAGVMSSSDGGGDGDSDAAARAVLERLSRLRLFQPDMLQLVDALARPVQSLLALFGTSLETETSFLFGLVLEAMEVMWEVPVGHEFGPEKDTVKTVCEKLVAHLRETANQTSTELTSQLDQEWDSLAPASGSSSSPPAPSTFPSPSTPASPPSVLSPEVVATLLRLDESFLLQPGGLVERLDAILLRFEALLAAHGLSLAADLFPWLRRMCDELLRPIREAEYVFPHGGLVETGLTLLVDVLKGNRLPIHDGFVSGIVTMLRSAASASVDAARGQLRHELKLPPRSKPADTSSDAGQPPLATVLAHSPLFSDAVFGSFDAVLSTLDKLAQHHDVALSDVVEAGLSVLDAPLDPLSRIPPSAPSAVSGESLKEAFLGLLDKATQNLVAPFLPEEHVAQLLSREDDGEEGEEEGKEDGAGQNAGAGQHAGVSQASPQPARFRLRSRSQKRRL